MNYMGNWTEAADENVDEVVKEFHLFKKLGEFDASAAVEQEFGTLVDLAKEVSRLTVAADVERIAADGAAVGAIFSFGLGMAAFLALEAAAAIQDAVASKKAGDLNAKLKTADDDIAKLVNPTVTAYVKAYKDNNDTIKSQAPKGFGTQQCRSILYEFMALIEADGKPLDTFHFKKYANSAKRFYNSEEIQEAYDALDNLNLSDGSKDDIIEAMGKLKVLSSMSGPKTAAPDGFLEGISLGIFRNRLKLAKKTVEAAAEEAEFGEFTIRSPGAFEALDALGKFALGVAVLVAVVDTVFEILDIVDIVKQTDELLTALRGKFKQFYLEYFKGMSDASQQYASGRANHLSDRHYSTTVGTYECHKYDGTKNKNDWHYVTIKEEGSQLCWSNRAGVSWMLTPRADGNLDVGKECPYYTNGHTVCQVVRNSTGSVTSLLGPWDEHYDAA